MDKRKNNGGHSTRSKGLDKRKNEYRDVLNDALTEKELISVLRMLYNKSIKKEDTNAAKILIEHYLGKPKQQIDTKVTHENPIFKGIDLDVRKDYSPE